MKTIIAGGRDMNNAVWVMNATHHCPWEITEVVSGGARGADALGEWWAMNSKIPLKRFLADWNTHGKAAGPIRNRQMAEYADALILIWDGKSRGSANMLKEARKAGLEIHEVLINPSAPR